MNKYYLLSFIFFSIGLFFFILAFINNEVEFGFVIFLPFIIGSGIYTFFGFIFVLIAIILLFFGFVNIYLTNTNFINYDIKNNETKKSAKFGGLILVGPIPIVIGSNWKITLIMLILGIFVLITLLVFFEII
jgi:uncharacterized protein (TIGR00304 family)